MDLEMHLFEHNGVIIIYTSSFRKYKKRIVVNSFNMFP